MNAKNNQMKRTPFFGSYILATTGNGMRKGSMKNKKKSSARMQQLYEMIDDYVEQA